MRDCYGFAVPYDREGPGFDVELLPFYGVVSLGNGTIYQVGMLSTGPRFFVGVERKGAFAFSYSFLKWQYVDEKLGLGNPSDAACFADFLNDQIQPFISSHIKTPRQGSYLRQWVLEKKV